MIHGRMEDLARRTGGRAYYNRNDLETGIRRALDDGRYTYELTYYPDHGDWSGEWRAISVKIGRPLCEEPTGVQRLFLGDCLHVLARSGYFALPDAKPAAHPDRQALVTRAINNPVEATQLPFTVHIVASPGQNGPEIKAALSIDARNLLTPQDEAHWKGNFELLFAQLGRNEFVDPNANSKRCCVLRRPLEVPMKTFDLVLNATEYQLATQKGFGTVKQLPLQPGADVLTIVLHDKNSDAIGSVRIPLGQYTTAPNKR